MTYIEVNYPIPFDLKTKRLDKHRKQFTGLNHARKLNPSHVMTVDADDCISRHLVEFVERHPEQNGWFIDRGYVYQEGKKSIFYKRKNFNHWCGTSNILRHDLHAYVENTESDAINYSEFYTGHQNIAKVMKKNNTPLESLPFPGTVYTISHQENASDEQGKAGNRESLLKSKNFLSLGKKILLNHRFLTQSIRDEFSLYCI
ncbi:glycosyltransferase family 2 protein [Lusitaniella coriacea]|uniref:glycosyltransferase family 2 protein n=1 Tax=Lusitaniella coriacea TaxID=1983105 RepID=UPI003CE962ED